MSQSSKIKKFGIPLLIYVALTWHGSPVTRQQVVIEFFLSLTVSGFTNKSVQFYALVRNILEPDTNIAFFNTTTLDVIYYIEFLNFTMRNFRVPTSSSSSSSISQNRKRLQN
jgi:hypothetical protein